MPHKRVQPCRRAVHARVTGRTRGSCHVCKKKNQTNDLGGGITDLINDKFTGYNDFPPMVLWWRETLLKGCNQKVHYNIRGGHATIVPVVVPYEIRGSFTPIWRSWLGKQGFPSFHRTSILPEEINEIHFLSKIFACMGIPQSLAHWRGTRAEKFAHPEE